MRWLGLWLAVGACVPEYPDDWDGDGWAGGEAGEDCDDTDPDIHPGAAETCDGVDEDCDGEVDEEATDAATFYADADGDGWGDAAEPATGCEAPSGFVAADRVGDCDDGDASVHPEAEETPYDGVDQDCDGADLVDVDGDGWAGGDDGEDCDDDDVAVHPGAFDWAGDAVDQDCDGLEDGIALDPDGALVGGAGDHLGAAVDAADLDGDGVPDVIVGADSADVAGADSGVAWVVPLGTAGLASTVATARLAGAAAGDAAGYAVHALPDVGDDGYPEVVVAAPLAEGDATGSGTVGVFFGPVVGEASLASPDVLLMGAGEGDFFGASLGSADFDGDGRGDLVIGATDVGVLGSEAGRVYVFTGVAGAVDREDADFVVTGGTAGGSLGKAIASGLDLNGDGMDDLVVSAARRTGDAGVVTIFFGPLDDAGCLGSCTTGDGDIRVISGDAQAGRFGSALADAGDLDGDGLSDLVIGDPGYTAVSGDEGAVFGFAGTTSDSELAVEADLLLLGGHVGDQAGASLAGGVDVDGDGRTDLLVGGPSGGEEPREGRAWLVLGPLSTTLVLTLADAVWVGDAAGDRAGYAVGLLPDGDGDGRAEVLLAAPGTGTDPGSLFFVTGP